MRGLFLHERGVCNLWFTLSFSALVGRLHFGRDGEFRKRSSEEALTRCHFLKYLIKFDVKSPAKYCEEKGEKLKKKG